MRTRGLSLTKAAKEAHVSRASVLRYVGSALSKTDSRYYQAAASDRFARSLRFLTAEGQIAITVRSSKSASRIALYWVAVDEYLKTGRTLKLRAFTGKSIRVGKQQFQFITDTRLLNRIASVGEVTFEDIYSHTR